MSTKHLRSGTAIAILTAVVTSTPRPRAAEAPEHLIVKCERPCHGVTAAVSVIGGEVTYSYENVDAVAVTVPADRVADVATAVGVRGILKDLTVQRPAPIAPLEVSAPAAVQSIGNDALQNFLSQLPADYNYNNELIGAAALHEAGQFGQDVVVAVIDTGVQLAAPAVGPVGGVPTVIGGQNLIPFTADPVASATSRLNDWHGTTVASMIAAHVAFVFPTTSSLVQALLAYSPDSVLPCPGPPFSVSCPETASFVPMIGVAPAAQIYALKVFPSTGGGAPESRIIAAMDRAITMRRNFNDGVPVTPVSGSGAEDDPFVYDSLDIEVVNMSLGGPTTFAGQDLEDQLTQAMVDAGIVLAVAAGNAGFGAMTVESPSSGFGALSVAAANTAVHERVLRDLQLGPGGGLLYRPSDGIQTAYFSSRGPLPDGRTGPHLIANGFASYTNAFAAVSSANALVSCGSPLAVADSCVSRVLFVSGTSFSSPTVAGAAALLRGAVPGAGAAKIRKALIRGANKRVLGDRSGPFDQGAGFLNVPGALALLDSALPGLHDDCDDEADDVGPSGCAARRADDKAEDAPDEVGAGGRSVIRNVRSAGVSIVDFKQDRFTAAVKRLRPGQVEQFFVPADARTDRLTIQISEVTPEGPQNTLFGDDLFVMGIDAPTSLAVHRISVPAGNTGAFVAGDTTFVIDNPQTGLFRLAVQGDWTNGGVISARVTIVRERSPLTPPSLSAPIEQDQVIPVTATVPPGLTQAVFELSWRQNWGRFPTNDLDMLILRPDGTLVVTGATLNSPERVVIANPPPGDWIVVIDGFLIHDTGKGPHSGRDRFTLRVTGDGSDIQVH